MGNSLAKLYCCGRREENQADESFRIVEEIPIEILDAMRVHEEPLYETSRSPEQNGIPQKRFRPRLDTPKENGISEEPIYETLDYSSQNGIFEDAEDNSEYIEMTKLEKTPLYLPLKDVTKISKEKAGESFQFRVNAHHYYISNRENRTIVDISVPADRLLNSDKMNCLFHISVYNSHRERIEDLTLIGGMSPNFMMEHVAYWRDSGENSWQCNFSSRDTQRTFEQYRLSSIKNVYVWASIVHDKNYSEHNKFVLLSGNPGMIPVSPDIKQSAGCVVHLTAYNLQLTKTLDVVLVQDNNPFTESECYSQFKNPSAESRTFSYSMPKLWTCSPSSSSSSLELTYPSGSRGHGSNQGF